MSDTNTVISEAVKQSGNQGVPGSYVLVGLSVVASAFGALWVYLRSLTNRLMATMRERIQAQERQLVALQEERDKQNERRVAEAKENGTLIVSAVHEATSAIRAAATSNQEVFDAIRTLDLDIRNLQQRIEDCRREISRERH